MTSRLALRIAGVVVVALVIGYIIRLQAEVARLQGRTAQSAGPDSNVTRARPSPPREAGRPAGSAAGPRTITAEQRQAMIERLGGRGTTQAHPVWFATVPNNPEAAALQRTLQGIFEEAGWQVGGNTPVKFAMKPGIYLFAAEEEPPEYVGMAHEALEAGGMSVTAGRGYREFYRQKKEENPSWIGLEMAPEQTYVIAVGRQGEDGPGAVAAGPARRWHCTRSCRRLPGCGRADGAAARAGATRRAPPRAATRR